MDKIQEYSLKNENGISITIISFGGIIKEINTPNSNGKIENIVLNYRSNNEYIIDKFYMGALIGRYANRIRGGKFKLGRNIIHTPNISLPQFKIRHNNDLIFFEKIFLILSII